MDLTPYRPDPDDPDALAAVLGLLRTGFAYMDGRIDPPSSLHRMTADSLRAQATTGELWTLGAPPVACMILTRHPGALHIGKLCVDGSERGRGRARQLIALAEARARAHALPALELQTRIELVENHATFTRLGFVEIARTAHPGHDRLTSLTFRKELVRN